MFEPVTALRERSRAKTPTALYSGKMADRPDLAIQPFEDGSQRAGPSGEGAGALITLPNGLQITEEEQQKRIKDVRLLSCAAPALRARR